MTRWLKQKDLIAMIVLFLSPIGCANTSTYIEPTTGDTARIRFATNTPNTSEVAVIVRSFKTEDCAFEKRGLADWLPKDFRHATLELS
jgi:hypothetical protein